MPSTNKTQTLNLTQYQNADIISFLDDYNMDMAKIDAFAATKDQHGGLASINEEGKIFPMPNYQDVAAAPTNHASENPTYGVATDTSYGHVKYGAAEGTACQGNDLRLLLPGCIQIWTGETPPNGFLLCNGEAVSRTTYEDLYAVIGTTYGSGDGDTTFNLPDLQGRIPVGMQTGDESFGTLGKTAGEATQKMIAAIGNNQIDGNQIAFLPSGIVPPDLQCYSRNEATQKADGYSPATRCTAVYDKDGNDPTTVQPYVTMNYIIKY